MKREWPLTFVAKVKCTYGASMHIACANVHVCERDPVFANIRNYCDGHAWCCTMYPCVTSSEES